MFEEFQICPYTGLRSFTEEESLYFKGREDHIEQATEQLQRNKFLMLTGASGDGKSSLVYAGIVPNARAGFLKSKYSQWCIADFRPERTPFKNLCKSVARQLGIANVTTTEAELQHGFSALIDLFKNSKRYVDSESIAWNQANDGGKATLKRDAANLIILVDQFEEFFTNPENYNLGVPSRDSNLVLNLLLETARIALEEDLPVYVVFTMRSDFIGQCAAFRGLPEYIGFSQFFVPRLNRSQLQQVIEQPAALSGNRITRRLTERLIHDITDGVDQLPILQHALNQIWHAANFGKEEMDLLHYAMVGGMSADELPDNQVATFNKWFEIQPTAVKAFYREPNLQNVLDTHTNKLFEQAAAYYASKTGRPISEADAKAIIKNTFTCLTKIDQSRAVRNRMTLQEIAHIFGRAESESRIIGTVLNIFREPGNTFIRPFITDDPESRTLSSDQVLDITHESLIRNWEYLGQWAKEEFDSYSVSLDFGQQLSRWVKSGKSKSHLFSIGPLTYFEGWYNKVKPNAWWIARYLPEEIDQEKKLVKANRILGNSKEFLEKSASKHAVTRAIMRYGPKRIAAVLAIFAVLTLSSFAVNDYFRQQNSYVLKSIHEQTLKLAADPKVVLGDRVTLVAEEMKLGQTTVDEVIKSITDPVEKINMATSVASLMIFQGWDQPKPEIFRCFALSDSLLESVNFFGQKGGPMGVLLSRVNQLRVALELSYYHNPDAQLAKWRSLNADRSARWVMHVAKTQPEDFADIQNFNLGLENAINYEALKKDEVTALLSTLSPFENGSPSAWVSRNFHRDKLLNRGNLDYGFQFNGLYQILAYLYASTGNSDRVLQCVDTLLTYGQPNYQADYAAGADNAANIASVFFRHGRTGDELSAFVRGYCGKKKTTEKDFYASVLGRTLHNYTTASNLHLYFWGDVASNLNLQFSSRDQLSFFFNKYREIVHSTVEESNEKNFLLALSFKNEGILKSLNKEKPAAHEMSPGQFFEKGVELIRKTELQYLDQTIPMIGVSAADQIIAPRKYLFAYPDLKLSFHPLEPRSFFFFYSSDVFLEYILDHNLFDWTYPGQKELGYLTIWLQDYNSKMFAPRGFLTKPVRSDVLRKLDAELTRRKGGSQQDFNWLYLYAGLSAQQQRDTMAMLQYYRKINPENIFNTMRSKEFGNNINNQSFRLVAYAVQGFALTNHLDEAYGLINVFKKPMNRSSLYAFSAIELQRKGIKGEMIQRLIDSSYVELRRVENLTTGQPHRQVLAYALAMQNPEANSEEAYRLIKNLGAKFIAIQFLCRAFGFHSMLYQAQSHIPDFISGTDQAIFLRQILYGYSEQQQRAERWNEFEKYYITSNTQWINYIDENI